MENKTEFLTVEKQRKSNKKVNIFNSYDSIVAI